MHPDRVQECRPDGSLYLLLRHRTCTFTMWSYVDVVATLYVLLLHLNFITGGRCLWWGVRRVTGFDGERMLRNSFFFWSLPSASETWSGMWILLKVRLCTFDRWLPSVNRLLTSTTDAAKPLLLKVQDLSYFRVAWLCLYSDLSNFTQLSSLETISIVGGGGGG